MNDARRIVLSECTLGDVEAQLRESPKVIVPVGSTEQHGPHAPFGTDSILATEVSMRLARRINALVAPTLTYGISGDHRGYAGVPFVSPQTLTALVQDESRQSLRRDERDRSEEHTSELQSHLNLVCRLLLEKKKKYK